MRIPLQHGEPRFVHRLRDQRLGRGRRRGKGLLLRASQLRRCNGETRSEKNHAEYSLGSRRRERSHGSTPSVGDSCASRDRRVGGKGWTRQSRRRLVFLHLGSSLFISSRRQMQLQILVREGARSEILFGSQRKRGGGEGASSFARLDSREPALSLSKGRLYIIFATGAACGPVSAYPPAKCAESDSERVPTTAPWCRA